MHFPFRRSAPATWASRLPQLQRKQDLSPSPEAPIPPPEPGGTLLTLTQSRPAPVTVRDVVADPVGAERLPPAALVSAVVACEAHNRELRRELTVRRRELRELKAGMTDHLVADGELRGRLRTLEEVIAALHENVEDLRLQRDQLLAQTGR